MNRNIRARKGERGIALLVALLALVVLTFLGLALAATTTTELQIATNYRRSQQALYNAEAGIEMGKIVLRDVVGSWASILPQARGVEWQWDGADPAAALPPAGLAAANRHWENSTCDDRGGKVGYGVVLSDGAPIEFRTSAFGQQVDGAFTVWVRREIFADNDGNFEDEPDDTVLILTSEGVAPYTNASMGGAFAQNNSAVRVLEVALTRSNTSTSFCATYSGQTGAGHSGAGFAMCSTISGGNQSLSAFTDACRGSTTASSAGMGSGGAGNLSDTGVN